METPNVPNKSQPGSRSSGSGPSWRLPIWYFVLMVVMLWAWQEIFNAARVQTIAYSEFKARVAARQVARVEIRQDEILGEIAPARGPSTNAATGIKPNGLSNSPAREARGVGVNSPTSDQSFSRTVERLFPRSQSSTSQVAEPFLFRTIRVEDPALVEELQAAGVEFAGVKPSVLAQFVLAWLLPIGVMIALWMYLGRKLSNAAGGGLLSIGKSKARLIAENATGVTFADVAGCDEAKFELQEIVDFLKNPNRYKSLGARIPKGALLIGPPGTGKTLLGRAVAGEALVPFFSLSGSDFVEMFVGVGAARVRDLFQQAKAQAPCIVFIDELDAIGRQRGVHVGAVNDEREQTLNQLLVEMDGFEANVGVIVLAATNRPEVLDRALLRPGRFDRQILVDSPDASGREAILQVHSRNKPLADDVDLRRIAQATPGFSGADLSNTINEAALLAARRKADRISQRDLEDAIEKVIAGPERKGRRLNDEGRRRVACHEVGHALVAVHSKTADPIHKISIVPRGRAALGYTMQLPIEDQFLLTRTALLERIQGLLGGRAAEEIVFSEVTTGAENDLERATTLARQMVAMFGMSKRLGLVHCAQRPNAFLSGPSPSPEIDCSEETAREIDREVKEILDEAYAGAKKLLNTHRDELDLVTARLLKDETLDAATFHHLIGVPLPEGLPPRPRLPIPVPDIEVPAACKGTPER